MSEDFIDDRRFSDVTQRVKFVERAPAKYEIQPLKFYTKDRAGIDVVYKIDFEILSVKSTGSGSYFEPLPDKGDIRTVWLYRADKPEFVIDEHMKNLRFLLAALMGETHSLGFKAAKPLQKLLNLNDLTSLDPIILEIRCSLKDKDPIMETHPETGHTMETPTGCWVNNYYSFSASK